jgi:hypothetical protein
VETIAKKILYRGAGGFVIGVFLGQLTQLILSLLIGNGMFLPVTSTFGSYFEMEIIAVIIQFFLTGLIGVALALGSFIFDISKWSLIKQHMVHLVSTGLVWITIVIVIWVPQSSIGIVIFVVNFIIAYLITYLIQYSTSKKDIKQINDVLMQREETGGK